VKTTRYSRQRESIYQYLLDAPHHPSAEMIYTDLKAENPELSLGTVYRNLRLLEEQGKVRRVINHQGNERYDAICGDHVHFVCQNCGGIIDVSNVDTAQLLEHITLEEGYQPEKTDLIITGCCRLCSGKV